MPSYKTHVRINLFFALPLSLTILYLLHATTREFFLFSITFIYGTLFLHPDLDVARKTSLFSLRGLLSLPFWPYSFFFRHRGLSHLPVLGTLTRLLWLYGTLALLCYFLKWSLPEISLKARDLRLLFSGLVVADLFHILLDEI